MSLKTSFLLFERIKAYLIRINIRNNENVIIKKKALKSVVNTYKIKKGNNHNIRLLK